MSRLDGSFERQSQQFSTTSLKSRIDPIFFPRIAKELARETLNTLVSFTLVLTSYIELHWNKAIVISDVREVFDLFDFWDGRDGLIGAEKVGNLLRCLGLNPTLALVKKMGGTDKPGEKQFSFEQFLPIVKSIAKVEDTGTYAEFCEAFKSFDREGQGYITAGEMNYMLTAMGERLSDAETDAIMTDTDTQPDLDGNLKYEEFIKKVLAGHAKK